ncbi:hypothetical protein BJX70DRAFT_363342 [Aspergillus crustosus]
MTPWFRQRCAEAGSCCGRPCQCCSESRHKHIPQIRSHCTPACVCCMVSRGRLGGWNIRRDLRFMPPGNIWMILAMGS